MSDTYHSIDVIMDILERINRGEFSNSESLRKLRQIKADLPNIRGNHKDLETLIDAKIREYS